MRPLLQIGNTDQNMIKRLHEIWGGVTFECTRKDRPKSKRIWSWRLYGLNLIQMLKRVSPYLVTKKGQAETITKWVTR
jgi:hypothetical protein